MRFVVKASRNYMAIMLEYMKSGFGRTVPVAQGNRTHFGLNLRLQKEKGFLCFMYWLDYRFWGF